MIINKVLTLKQKKKNHLAILKLFYLLLDAGVRVCCLYIYRALGVKLLLRCALQCKVCAADCSVYFSTAIITLIYNIFLLPLLSYFYLSPFCFLFFCNIYVKHKYKGKKSKMNKNSTFQFYSTHICVCKYIFTWIIDQ